MLPARRRLLLITAILLVLVAAAAYTMRAPLLRGAAHAWIVDDPTVKADAIVILGGGMEYRPFEAARLFTNGIAPVILVAQEEPSPTQQAGLTVAATETTRKLLVQLGVPEAAIQPLGTNVTSTRDEAFAFRDWAQQHHAGSVLIPTDIFHTRRARWIFQKALKGTGVDVRMAAITLPRYSPTNWWQKEEGLIAFQNEVIKSAFYHLRY